MDNFDLQPEEILYMGMCPDIPVMKKVAVAACPHDAVSDVSKLPTVSIKREEKIVYFVVGKPCVFKENGWPI